MLIMRWGARASCLPYSASRRILLALRNGGFPAAERVDGWKAVLPVHGRGFSGPVSFIGGLNAGAALVFVETGLGLPK